MDGGTKGEINFEFSTEVVPLWPWDYHQYEPPGSVNHSSLYNCHLKNPCESCKKKESSQLMWTPPPSPPASHTTETSSSSLEENKQESTAVIGKATPIDLDLAIMMMTPRECKVHPGEKCFICSESTDEMLQLISWIIQGDVLESEKEEKKGEGTVEKNSAAEVMRTSSTCSSAESDDDSSTNPTLMVSNFQKVRGEKEETDDSAALIWAQVNEGTSGYQSLLSDTHHKPISSEQSLRSHVTGSSRYLPENEARVNMQLTRARVIPSSRDLSCNCPRPLKYPGSSNSAHADLNIGYHQPVPTSLPPPPIMHMPYHRVQTYSYAPPPYYPTVSCPPPHAFFAGVHVNYINHMYPFPSHHYPPPGPDAYECRKVQEKLSDDKVRDNASNYRKSASALGGTPITSPRGFQLKSHEFPSLTSQNETHRTSSNLSPQLGKKNQRSIESAIKASNDLQGKQVLLSDPYVKNPKVSPVKATHELPSPTSPRSLSLETPVKDGQDQDQVLERIETNVNGMMKADEKSRDKLMKRGDDLSDQYQNAEESVMNEVEDDLEASNVKVVEVKEAAAIAEQMGTEENDPTMMIDDIVSKKVDQESEAIEEPDGLENSSTKEKKKTKSKKALKKAKKLAAKAAKSKTELHQPDANGIKSSFSDSRLLIATSTISRSRKSKRDLNPDMRIPRSMRIRAMVACRQNLSAVDSMDEEDTATDPASEDESSPEDYEPSRIDEHVDEQQCIDSIPDDFSLMQRKKKRTNDTKCSDKDASVQTE